MSLADVRRKLSLAAGDEFHKLASNILQELLPGYRDTQRRKELDRLGIDAWLPGNAQRGFELIVQYKGFEKANFEREQQAQLLNEIEKFSKARVQTHSYWIVHNRFISNPDFRFQIESALNSLVSASQVSDARCLDLDQFLTQIREVGIAEFRSRAKKFAETVISEYRSRLSSGASIHQVPFSVEKNGYFYGRDPSEWLRDEIRTFLKSLRPHQTSKHRFAPTYLVEATFGFGKTTTLHRLAELLWPKNIVPIIIPAALLTDNAFRNTSGISESLIDLLWDDTDISDDTRACLTYAVRKELAKTASWVLIIDGLDENHNAWDEKKFNCLRNGLWELGVPQVIALRSEMMTLRQSSIIEALQGPKRSPLEIISLETWNADAMTRFVEQRLRELGERASPEVTEFSDIIKSGHYQEVYGDIPARPMFLSLLFDQARRGFRPDNRLHRLLEEFVLIKLHRDLAGHAALGLQQRPGSKHVAAIGSDEFGAMMIRVVSRIAHQIYSAKPYTGLIEQFSVNKLLREEFSDGLLPSEIMNFSLLLPSGREKRTRERLYRFAHKAFEDWALANYFFMIATAPPDDINENARSLWRAMEQA